jgi:hypothetical protein
MLTLDDGRKLRVALTGGIAELAGDDGDSTLIPTITIDVDSSVAGMDQAEIRKRLQLLPGNICWRSHWTDAELLANAEAQATEHCRRRAGLAARRHRVARWPEPGDAA